MVYCSAHFCKNERGKVLNISFHEFPVDLELREQWLESMKRKDWIPHDRSVICSAHFRNDDFKPEKKYRWLKPGSVPTIFQDYPENLQQSIVRLSAKRRASKTRKRIKLNENNNNNNEVENDFLEIIVNSEVTESSVSHVFCYTESVCGNSPKTRTVLDTLNIQEAEPETLDTISSSPTVKQNLCKVGRPITVRNYKLNVPGSRAIRLKKKVENLRQELKEMKANEKELESKLKKIRQIEGDAMNGDRSSIFLNQQINAYGMKSTKWTEAVIRESIIFKAESPKGYKYARRRGLLKLPSPSALKRYMGLSTGELDSTSLVKQRLHAECSRLTQVEKYGSIVCDEMVIKPATKNVPDFDKIVGQQDLEEMGVQREPANRLLCFVFKGLSKAIRIPVLYFFTGQLTAQELKPLFLRTVHLVEEAGFCVIRLICDNSSANTSAYRLFCESADLKPDIPHPEDST